MAMKQKQKQFFSFVDIGSMEMNVILDKEKNSIDKPITIT